MNFKLYRCEVVYNLAVTLNELGQNNASDKYRIEARSLIRTDTHRRVIDSREGITLFGLPNSCVFEVSASKLKNMKKKNYLEEVTLSSPPSNGEGEFLGFSGATILNPKLTIQSTLVRRQKKEQTPLSPISVLSPLSPSSAISMSGPPSLQRGVRNEARGHSRQSSLPNLPSHTNVPRRARSSSLPNGRANRSDRVDTLNRVKEERLSENEWERLSVTSSSYVKDGDVKIKLHSNKKTVLIAVSRNTTLESLFDLVQRTLNLKGWPIMCFEDEEVMVTIIDQADLEMAICEPGLVHIYVEDSPDEVLNYY